jgi:hypothetical protein
MNSQETRKTSKLRSRIAGTAVAAALLAGAGAGTAVLTAQSASAHDQSSSASSRHLADRIDRLENAEEIRQLKARYFRFVDEKKWDDLAALFTPDAKILTDGVPFKTSKEFAYTIRDLTGPAPSAHSGAMPEIAITGRDTATGIWSMEDILNVPAGPNAIVEGHNGYGQYHETYKKVHGRWLIDSIVLTRFWVDPLPSWTPPKSTGATNSR